MLIGIDQGDPAGDQCWVARVRTYMQQIKSPRRRHKPYYAIGDKPPPLRSASVRKRRRIIISRMKGRALVIELKYQPLHHIESIDRIMNQDPSSSVIRAFLDALNKCDEKFNG